jgi:hypothetical protein
MVKPVSAETNATARREISEMFDKIMAEEPDAEILGILNVADLFWDPKNKYLRIRDIVYQRLVRYLDAEIQKNEA